ncbi:MAG: hypothetical protein LBL98_07125 [Ruminococcus sp.]|nr:hypothetical protein [Ruminococcus sp.]
MNKKLPVLIILICFAVGIVIGLTVGILSKNFADKDEPINNAELLEIHDEMFTMFAENFEWQLDSVEKRALADAERVGNYLGANGLLNSVQLSKFLDPNFPYTEIYYALETDGRYIGTSPNPDIFIDYRDRPWYKGAKTAGGVFITEPYETATNASGDRIITFSYPIFRSDGSIIGVCAIDMNASELAARLLPRDIAPYIKGIQMFTESGEIAPFFDYKQDFSSAPLVTDITNNRHRFGIRIFGDFTEYDKTLRKMTYEEAKLAFEETTNAQLLYQLKSSTDYIKFNVGRNAALYNRITAQKTSDFLHTLASGVNTGNWAYDDIYYVMDFDGKYIGIDDTVSKEIDFRKRPWYIDAKESGEVVWTDYYESVTGSRQEIMTFTAPLRDANDNFVGAVGFDITTETAKSMLYNGNASLEILLTFIR